MNRRLLCAALPALLLAGCGEPQDDTHEGIAVGNPGVVSLSLAEADTFVFTEMTLPVEWVGFGGCDGGARFAYPAAADLVVEPLRVTVPVGEWCGVQVAFLGDATLTADWSDGLGGSGSLSANLVLSDVGLQVVDDAQRIEGGVELALELASPDWLDPDALGMADGVDLVVDVGDPAHDLIVAAFTDESAVFADEDGSGRVDPDERDAGAVALPATLGLDPNLGDSTADAAGGSAGCSGCASSGSPGTASAWFFFLMGGLVLGRRRRRPLDPPIAARGPRRHHRHSPFDPPIAARGSRRHHRPSPLDPSISPP